MSKITASLCLVCLMLTVLWLGLLITDMATAGPLETFEQVAAHASRLHGLFYATYLNAALLTVAAVALFAALVRLAQAYRTRLDRYRASLCAHLWRAQPGRLSLAGDARPGVGDATPRPTNTATADALLRLTLQAWPQSAMAFFNGLAYAILGIPSILYGACYCGAAARCAGAACCWRSTARLASWA